MLIADLHIHSKYSRATSKDCGPEALDLWARKKGIGLVGTGDFTHPASPGHPDLGRKGRRAPQRPAQAGEQAAQPVRPAVGFFTQAALYPAAPRAIIKP